MWILFGLFLVFWIISVEMALPIALVITLFAMVVGSAAVAMMPHAHESIEHDHE